jgi:hypothetical protein
MAGRRRITDRDAARLDEHFDLGGHFQRLLRYARLGSDKEWFGQFVHLEAQARVIKSYQALAIPGLLQLPEYAAELIRAGGASDVEALVEERIGRQLVLDRDPAPMLWILLSQNAIDWPVGETGLMRDQLAHVLAMASRPNIGIRVVPRSAGTHSGFDGSFSIIHPWRVRRRCIH